MTQRRRGAFGFLVLLMLAQGLSAQTGTITGSVLDASTRRPLGAAQVFIRDLRTGGLTSAEGRYLLLNVPVGTHQVGVTLIGYGSVTREVTVTAGAVAPMNFELSATAISLDEVVVTGTGVQEQRRQLGSSSASLGTDALTQRPVLDVTNALRGQIAGVLPSAPQGEVGSAAPMRLRGQVSLSQRNDPIVYVDGVRQDNSMGQIGAIHTSRLDDVNPADIERIEVIKGAAAATLFGTEASAGVIQIFTKRGTSGQPKYEFSVDGGTATLPLKTIPPNQAYDRVNKKIVTNDPIGDIVQHGLLQNYSLSVSGGTPSISYYLSGRFRDQTGTVPTSANQNMSLRSSIDIAHSEKLRTEISFNVIRNETQTPNGSASIGIVGVHTLANPLNADPAKGRPYGETFVSMIDALDQQAIEWINRYTIDAKTSYQWAQKLTSQFVVGYNHVVTEDTETAELGTGTVKNLTGRRGVNNSERSALTLDFNTSYQGSVSEGVGYRVWVGGQAFNEKRQTVNAAVIDFPAPGLRTLSGGGRVSTLTETFSEVINAGVFAQAQLDVGNRLFVTAGLRADGNSAFGKDFGLSKYPKVSASYVMSDEGFWPGGETVNLLRFRSAYGVSGLQPGAFDATQTWNPRTRLNGVAIVWADNIGNPALKPERSAELEMGVDLGLFNNRVGIELTHFRQKTTDAIIPKPAPASQGFANAQLANIGQLKSLGFEALLKLQVVQRPSFSWDVTGTLGTLDQKVVELGLGSQKDYLLGGSRAQQFVAVGYAPGVYRTAVIDEKTPYKLSVASEDKITRLEDIIPQTLKNSAGGDSLVYFKATVPTLNASVGTEFTLPGALRLNVLFSGARGFSVTSEADLIWYQNKTGRGAALLEQELDNPATTAERRKEIAIQHAHNAATIFGNYVEDGDFIRFQTLSLSYPVPRSIISKLGFSSMTASAAVQNLKLWTKWTGVGDPGSANQSALDNRAVLLTVQRFHLPSPREFTFSLRGGW